MVSHFYFEEPLGGLNAIWSAPARPLFGTLFAFLVGPTATVDAKSF